MEGDPEWPEVPRFFLMRCGETLEESELGACAQAGQDVTCPECRENPPPGGGKKELEEACTTF